MGEQGNFHAPNMGETGNYKAPNMGEQCKVNAPNMGVNVLQSFDNDNWLWQIDNWLQQWQWQGFQNEPTIIDERIPKRIPKLI